jgi:hypothetical protein
LSALSIPPHSAPHSRTKCQSGLNSPP